TYPGLTKKVEGAVEANEPDVYYEGCKRNYTRVVPSDEIQGAAAANWSKQLGATKVYVLDDTELYGHGIAVVYANTAPKVGLQVVGGPEGIDSKASDYRALAQKVRQSGADLVFFGGITQNNAGKLWQDLRATLGNDVKLMGPDGIFEQAFVDAAGPASQERRIRRRQRADAGSAEVAFVFPQRGPVVVEGPAQTECRPLTLRLDGALATLSAKRVNNTNYLPVQARDPIIRATSSLQA